MATINIIRILNKKEESIRRETEHIEMTQIKRLEINNTTSYMKTTLDWLNRLDSAD